MVAVVTQCRSATRCSNALLLLGVLLAVVIGVGLGLLIGALLFTILLLKNKYAVFSDAFDISHLYRVDKFPTKSVLVYPPHLKYVAALPCET